MRFLPDDEDDAGRSLARPKGSALAAGLGLSGLGLRGRLPPLRSLRRETQSLEEFVRYVKLEREAMTEMAATAIEQDVAMSRLETQRLETQLDLERRQLKAVRQRMELEDERKNLQFERHLADLSDQLGIPRDRLRTLLEKAQRSKDAESPFMFDPDGLEIG